MRVEASFTAEDKTTLQEPPLGLNSELRGAGIYGSSAASPFVIYGVSCPVESGAILDALAASLDFTCQAEVSVFGSEKVD